MAHFLKMVPLLNCLYYNEIKTTIKLPPIAIQNITDHLPQILPPPPHSQSTQPLGKFRISERHYALSCWLCPQVWTNSDFFPLKKNIFMYIQYYFLIKYVDNILLIGNRESGRSTSSPYFARLASFRTEAFANLYSEHQAERTGG